MTLWVSTVAISTLRFYFCQVRNGLPSVTGPTPD